MRARLLLALLVAPAFAGADTLTIRRADTIIEYDGTVLAIDQLRVDADLRFRGSVAWTTAAPAVARKLRAAIRPGSWSVQIDDLDAVPLYAADDCLIAALAYLEAGGMHIYLDCTWSTSP